MGGIGLAKRLSLGKRILFGLVVFMGAISLLAAAGEIGLRWFTPAPAFAASLNMYAYSRITCEPTLNGVSSPVRHTTNKWGMRGSDPPEGPAARETTTIITVGGSTTQCFYLDDKHTWSHIMERELQRRGHKVWVGNAGQDGHSTRGHVLMMDKVVSAVGADYVVFLVGVNDLSLSLDATWKTGNAFDQDMTLALGPPRSGKLNLILDHSRLAHRLHQLKKIYVDGVSVRKVYHTGSIPSEQLTGPEDQVPENLDDILPSLPLFRRNVLYLARAARAIDAVPVFLTQPTLFEDSERWRGIRARTFWIGKERLNLSAANYARLLDHFNKELVDLCAANDIACLDLANEMPHSDTFFYDMVHFNDAGAELAGKKVAAFLDERCFAH